MTGGGIVSTIGKVDFDNPLKIPPLAQSSTDDQGRRVFDLTAKQGESEFVPGSKTTTWGFNGDYLGPTLRVSRGETVLVNVHNQLDAPTAVHWHGMHLPARMDGGPHQMIAAGGEWSPTWTVNQPATTLWYHPHPHGQTEKHVTMGLAGMFIIDDPIEAALPLPRDYGIDDIPAIVQDVRFTVDHQLTTSTRGFVGPIGNQILVNGTLGPFFEVTTDVVRIRLLNASAARVYNFGFSDGKEFALVGTDGGLLDKPFTTDHIQLSPAERAEILVSMVPGETVTLRSTPPYLGIDAAAAGMNAGSDSFDILQLRAANTLVSTGTVPESLAPIDRLRAEDATVHRDFLLDGFEINGNQMDMGRIDEVIRVGTTETWSVTNTQNMPHSFHIHDVQFQILTIGGAPPPPELAGWKDTVYLTPHREFTLIMKFTDYTDPNFPYMYHCHLLWHEDLGMMGQFVVIGPGQQVGSPPLTNEGHDHGH